MEEVVSSNPVAPLSRESASGPSAPSTQTRLQNVRKALREMTYLTDYMIDSGVAAAVHSGFDGGRDTPPSSLPVIRDERPVSHAVAAIDVQVHTTPVGVTEQVACTTEPPSTTLLASTELAALVTPLTPRASSTSSLSSAPNKSQSPSPELRRSQRHGAGRK